MDEHRETGRLSRLKGVIEGALTAFPDLPKPLRASGVDTIANSLMSVTSVPSTAEVAEIVKVALEKSGEGLIDAASLAGDIAEKIVDGLGSLDLPT